MPAPTQKPEFQTAIPKQPEESVFCSVSFTSEFLSSLTPAMSIRQVIKLSPAG